MKRFHTILAVLSTITAMSVVSCEKEKIHHLSITGVPENLDGREMTITAKINTDLEPDQINLGYTQTWIDIELNGKDLVIHIPENNVVDMREVYIFVTDKTNPANQVVSHIVQPRYRPVATCAEGMVQFKDYFFKQACLEIADTDNDGEISYEEAEAVQELNISGRKIWDITGIEAFKNVWKIDAQDNAIADGSLIADHRYLHWLDLKGNKTLKTFDVRGCTAYFEHCEFEVTDDLLYYCWRRQVNITTASDPENKHSKHVKDTRETTDWSRHTRQVILNEHTKGEGKAIINFSGLGYINDDLEDGTFDRVMRESFELVKKYFPRVTEHLEEIDVYYMEYLTERRDLWMCEWEDYLTPATNEMGESWIKGSTKYFETSRKVSTQGKPKDYILLTISMDMSIIPNHPQIPRTTGVTEIQYTGKGNSRHWITENAMNVYPDNHDNEDVYVTLTPEELLKIWNESINIFIDKAFGE